MNKKLLAILLPTALLLPVLAFAAIVPDCVNDPSRGVDCGFNDLVQIVNNAITWFLSVAVAAAAITLSIAGAKMLLNPGNTGKRAEAIEMIKKTVIGLIIVLISWLVIHTAVATIVKGGNPLRFLGGS